MENASFKMVLSKETTLTNFLTLTDIAGPVGHVLHLPLRDTHRGLFKIGEICSVTSDLHRAGKLVTIAPQVS